MQIPATDHDAETCEDASAVPIGDPKTEAMIQDVRYAMEGDKDAFARLYDQYSTTVFAVAIRRCRHREDALELTNEVFLQVQRKFHTLRDPSAFPGWLRKITVRLTINHCVRGKKSTSLSSDPDIGRENHSLSASERDAPHVIVENRDNLKMVLQAVQGMKFLDRTTLTQFYLQEMSLNEMSAESDAPVGTIKRRLHMARNRLRKKLNEMNIS